MSATTWQELGSILMRLFCSLSLPENFIPVFSHDDGNMAVFSHDDGNMALFSHDDGNMALFSHDGGNMAPYLVLLTS